MSNEKTAKKEKPAITPKMPNVPVVMVDGPTKEKAPKAPRATKTGSKFVLLKELDKDTKMPLQCRQIVETLSAAPGKELDKVDLIKALDPIVKRRQPLERIVGFYQSRLVAGGWVKIVPIVAVKEAAAEAASAPETPAPAPAA